jgi:hypothetical protein
MVEEVAAEVIEESPTKETAPKKASSRRAGTKKKVEVSAKAD